MPINPLQHLYNQSGKHNVAGVMHPPMKDQARQFNYQGPLALTAQAANMAMRSGRSIETLSSAARSSACTVGRDQICSAFSALEDSI
jgi:hypothetical protein